MSLSRAYSPHEHKPLGGYAALTLLFNLAIAAFAVAQQRSGRKLPERIPPTDVLLMSAATHKLSRLIAKDRVTSFARAPFTRYVGESSASEVSEEPRGEGLQRAIGELLGCPYCLGQWVAAGLLATYLRRPRSARTVAALFAIGGGADFLQQAWSAVEKTA